MHIFTVYRRGYPLPLILLTGTTGGGAATNFEWSYEWAQSTLDDTSHTPGESQPSARCRVRLQRKPSPYGVAERETSTISPGGLDASGRTFNWR